MTKPEALRHAADIYEAHERGESVQFIQHPTSGQWIEAVPNPRNFPFPSLPESAPGLWRIAPKPETRPWNCPADVPMPMCWIRKKSDRLPFSGLVVFIDNSGIYWGSNGTACGGVVLFTGLRDYEHSTDGRNWHPCTVEVKQ